METQKAFSWNLEEYKTLRDETLKRIDARNQILSFTLVFAASMFTLALGTGNYRSALLIYPIVAFFFSTSYAFNSLVLIEIGAYLRQLEPTIEGLGWATHLRPRFPAIEIFELTASAGLFVGTELVGLVVYYSTDSAEKALQTLATISWAACVLTVLTVIYPWLHHRAVMKRR
jgi:hypothetical protein